MVDDLIATRDQASENVSSLDRALRREIESINSSMRSDIEQLDEEVNNQLSSIEEDLNDGLKREQNERINLQNSAATTDSIIQGMEEEVQYLHQRITTLGLLLAIMASVALGMGIFAIVSVDRGKAR